MKHSLKPFNRSSSLFIFLDILSRIFRFQPFENLDVRIAWQETYEKEGKNTKSRSDTRNPEPHSCAPAIEMVLDIRKPKFRA